MRFIFTLKVNHFQFSSISLSPLVPFEVTILNQNLRTMAWKDVRKISKAISSRWFEAIGNKVFEILVQGRLGITACLKLSETYARSGMNLSGLLGVLAKNSSRSPLFGRFSISLFEPEAFSTNLRTPFCSIW